MEQSKHTPTPWLLSGDFAFGLEGGPVGMVFGQGPEAKANAALIVRAVNSHADLVFALEWMLKLYPAFRSKPLGEAGSPMRSEQDEQINAEDAARAALKYAG